MKKNHNILLILAMIVQLAFFSSCSKRTYAPALYHHDIAYQPKPASFDSVKTANYFSVGGFMYTDVSWSDMITMGQANFTRAHVFNNANLSYGVFGGIGDYNGGSTVKSPYDFTDKYFGVVGGRISANLFTSYERMDFRYIGIEAAYSHELGAYSQFRDFLYEHQQFNVDTRTDLYTVGLTSEVIFHNRNNTDIQHAIRLFVGGTFGPDPYNRIEYASEVFTPKPFQRFFPSVSYYLKVHNFFATVEAGSQFAVRAGLKF